MIKDFIEIFKKSYKEYNKEKLIAKAKLVKLKKLLKGQAEVYKMFDKCKSLMDMLYVYCPEYERTGIFQNFYDFLTLRYKTAEAGIENSASYSNEGYVKKMRNLSLYLQTDIKRAGELYKAKNYTECSEYIDKAMKFVKDEYDGVKALVTKAKRKDAWDLDCVISLQE